GGARLTNEECSLVDRLFAKGLGTPHVDHRSAARATGGALQDLAGLPVPMRDVETADAIVLVALDPTEELPILWLRMRKAIRAGVLMRAPNAMGALRAGLIPGERGVAGGQLIASAAEGRLRALYLIGVDPLRTFPDRDLVERALRRVDFLVVQDIAPSATAGK